MQEGFVGQISMGQAFEMEVLFVYPVGYVIVKTSSQFNSSTGKAKFMRYDRDQIDVSSDEISDCI